MGLDAAKKQRVCSATQFLACSAILCAATMGSSQAALIENTLWIGNDTQAFLGAVNTDTSGNAVQTIPNLSATGFAINQATNTMYVSQGGNRIATVDLTDLSVDSVTVVPDQNLTARNGFFEDMTFDGQSIWVADFFTAPTSFGSPVLPGAIRQIDPTSLTVTSHFMPSGILYPVGIAWDGSGFWVSGCTSEWIVGVNSPCLGTGSGYIVSRYSAAGVATGQSFTFDGDLVGLAFDPRDDTLWIGGFGIVRHFTTDGMLLGSFAIEPNRFADGLEFVGSPDSTAVPEPASLGLIGLGLIGLLGLGRRRSRSN